MNRLLIIDTNKKNQDGITAMVSEIIKKSSIAPGVTNDKEGTISLSFQIDHAYRAKDALSKVKKAKEEDTPFALIIMDSTVLPGTDRVETITRIRETDPHAEILIYTSPQEYSWDAINNKPENCYHIIFLQKPVNPVELRHILFSLISKWNKDHETRQLITQLKHEAEERTKQVKNLLDQLEEAQRGKTQFFINFAHDTKTPLTLIKNYLEKYIAKIGVIDKDLKMVKYNVDMFLRDVVNFLDAKKLERGQTFYDHAKITHLSEIVDIKSTLFRESAYKKQITITSHVEPGIYIKADSFAVDRILNNLLDNAVKYTDKGGSINVSLTMVKKKVLLEISDTGIGIPQNQLDKIFEPYYQISHEKRNIQGIGMGLFIIKNIIDEIRGSIEVASELNKGTTFRIFLKRHTVTKKELQDKDNQYSTPLERDHFSFKKREDTIRAGKYNILLVDDNIEILNLLESSLEHLYNVFPFTNGKEALESLGKIPIPDLIISDIMMDVMDGHEFFKNISASKEYSHIPFIFLTAKNSLKEKIKSLRKGAVDYIYKPFLIEEIIAKIESIVMQKKKYDEQKFKDRFEKACSDNELTCREKDVLELLAKGLMYKEISSILNISMKTVEYHIHNIYTKFSVQSIAELMRTLM